MRIGFLLLVLLYVAALIYVKDAHAQQPIVSGDPEEAAQTIYQYGGPYAPCMVNIVLGREDVTGVLHQPNLQGSGAVGWFQFLPSTFASTSIGKTVDIWHASGPQQVMGARELFENGTAKYHWAPLPC